MLLKKKLTSCFGYLSFYKIFLITSLLLSYPVPHAKANCTNNEGDVNVREAIHKIPENHRQILENFFRTLIINHAFGYTLFGDKPAASETIPPFQDLARIKAWLPLIQGWKIWQKYQKLFPSQSFAFEEVKHGQDESASYSIVIINLKKSDKIKEFIPGQANICTYLCQLIGKNILSPDEHEKLGILLGFGEQNSKRFARTMEIFNLLTELPHFPENIPEQFNDLNAEEIKHIFYQKLKSKPLVQGSRRNWNSLVREYNSLTKEWLSLDQIYPQGPMTCIRFPVFIADKDLDETRKLYESYSNTRSKLMTILNSENFLELIIEKYVRGCLESHDLGALLLKCPKNALGYV